MAIPKITVTFDPPQVTDSQDVFDTKAFDTVGKLNTLGSQLNDAIDGIDEAADALNDPAVQQVVANIPAIIAAPTHAANAASSAASALASRNDAAASAANAAAIVWDGATGLPKSRPSLNLDFVNSRILDPRITFTRASTATYFDAMGVLRTAAAGEPRFDYDPVTGECLGLLIEGQATNLLVWSEKFDEATWSKTNALVSQDGTTLDGYNEMWLLRENSENTPHYISTTSIFVSGVTYTASVYVKKYSGGGKRYFTLLALAEVSGATSRVTVDLDTGEFFSVGNLLGHTIIPLGNGCFKVSITFPCVMDGASPGIQLRVGQTLIDTLAGYEGDGVSGLYIWGAQLEEGTAPTSYIKTEASQVTRAQDSAHIEDISWYNFEEGTFFVHAASFRKSGASRMFSMQGANISVNSIFAGFGGGATAVQMQVFKNSVNAHWQSSISNPDVMAAMSFSNEEFRATIGASPVSVPLPNGAPTEVDRLYIGRDNGVLSHLNGHIKRISYYPRALPDAELIALTSL